MCGDGHNSCVGIEIMMVVRQRSRAEIRTGCKCERKRDTTRGLRADGESETTRAVWCHDDLTKKDRYDVE
jgi:hypothetical protein